MRKPRSKHTVMSGVFKNSVITNDEMTTSLHTTT